MIIKKLFNKYKHLRFIDLSADFRITDPLIYKKNYKKKHKAVSLIKNSIYSISEFVQHDIKNYRIVANPGCYPTSIQIPLIPLIKNNLISLKNIIIDSKSGYSGAGKKLEKKFTHKNLYHSTFAYSPKTHRHVVEIDQEIKKLTSKKINFSFNPHILPTFRGILSCIYVDLKRRISARKIKKVLDRYYKSHNFIKILKFNTNLGSGNVLNSNNCEISVCETRLKNKIVIFCAIDNLVKGASGQAIQNMNLLFKFNERLGLKWKFYYS